MNEDDITSLMALADAYATQVGATGLARLSGQATPTLENAVRRCRDNLQNRLLDIMERIDT